MKSITIKYWSDIPENYTGHVKFTSGNQTWYKNGKLHREDGPAIIWSDGMQGWYKNGKFHREDGPALIYANGTQEWYKNGKQINPPKETMKLITVKDWSDIPYNYTGHVKHTDGTQNWYYEGYLHREDGPAVIYADGTQEWWKNGKQINPPKETSTINSNPETSPLYKTANKNLLEHQCKKEYWQGWHDALKEVSKTLNIKL